MILAAFLAVIVATFVLWSSLRLAWLANAGVVVHLVNDKRRPTRAFPVLALAVSLAFAAWYWSYVTGGYYSPRFDFPAWASRAFHALSWSGRLDHAHKEALKAFVVFLPMFATISFSAGFIEAYFRSVPSKRDCPQNLAG